MTLQYQTNFFSLPTNEQILLRDCIHHEEALRLEEKITKMVNYLQEIGHERSHQETCDFLQEPPSEVISEERNYGTGFIIYLLSKEKREKIIKILEWIRGNHPKVRYTDARYSYRTPSFEIIPKIIALLTETIKNQTDKDGCLQIDYLSIRIAQLLMQEFHMDLSSDISNGYYNEMGGIDDARECLKEVETIIAMIKNEQTYC